jgi:molecular chaperone DnaK
LLVSVVGIDLGTTNTVVACVRSGKVHVLADEHGARLLPSVVSFHPNGEVLVGASAKARRVIDPRNTVYSHKRLIGRSWGSPEIAQAKSRFAFELKEGPGQGPLIRARGQDYTLPEISAFVLKRTRQIAETALGGAVERAVITVPAHFNELQRASTKVAGRVSGLEVLRILNEPTAAALAYGLGRTGNERVAVYDFGGGTFDCTLLDLNGNVFEVLATAGDSFLGGDDVDNLIAERMAETYLKAHRYDPRTDPQMLERLKTTAEDIKMVLSTAETHTVVLKEFGHGAQGSSINYTFTMTRRDLDHMITPLVDRSFKVTQDALALARLSPTSFDKIILVGGSTRMPLVRKRVEAFFGQAPLDRVNPDEVVAIGAAIQAAALTEGMRKRSIPAPPGVIGQKPRTLPGLNSEENTQTGMLEASDMSGKPGAAFGSNPPSFGFHPASSPPPAMRSGPPAAFGSSPGAIGGATGARSPNAMQSGGPRKITNPGVAPATQPMGARPAGQPAPPPGNDDDPSIASFPDLSAPTPFEWFPSGHPASGDGARSGGSGGFGGNTITATGVEQNTLTAAVDQPGVAGGPAAFGSRPAAGRPASAPGFGAIDEPPSLMSTPSASVPSFPSMTGTSTPGMPSPIGEPEAFAEGNVPGGQFGAVRDLSLISTSGVSQPGVGSDPGELGFGHVSDLSLVSTSSATGQIDGVAEARQKLLDAYEDETEANLVEGGGKGGTMNLEPAANPGARVPPLQPNPDDAADLPALAQPTDLPSVAGQHGKKRPEIRKPGQLGMSSAGGASMAGKPPPKMAPQPFGPMEKIGGDEAPPSRTAAMQSPQAQARPPQSAPASKPGPSGQPARQAAQPARTGAMPARTGAPLATTAPLNQHQPNQPGPAPLNQTAPLAQQSPVARAPGAATPFGSAPPAAFGSVPPAFGSASPFGGPGGQRGPGSPPPNAAFQSTPGLPPQGMQAAQQSPPAAATAQFGSFGAGPPPAQAYPSAPPPPQAFASQPPPQQQAFASQPPQAYGHGGSPAHPSQPPIFGAYQSSPPDAPLDVHAMGQNSYDPHTMPLAPGMPQNLGFQAPVLVDVTPRGLVVETAGGYTDTIIPRNSKIPCERTRRFATGRDMQTTVRVRVGQGESPQFPQNTFLGEVELSGLRPAPRGEVTVAVTFEVDADGTLRIRARDVQTGQEARATLQLIGVADESSVVMMINRFAQQPVVGSETPRNETPRNETPRGPTH